MTYVAWFNVALALVASAVAFGALNKIQWGATKPCVALAYLLIFLGMAAQWLGQISEQWNHTADTATFGGVLALLLASQREQTWLLERWANPVASVVAVGAFALFVGQLFI